MPPSSHSLQPYMCFAKDPQAFGTWQLEINLTPRGLHSLTSLVNLPRYSIYPSQFHKYRLAIGDMGGEPPTLVPRLFAYLRAALPQATTRELPPLLPPRPQPPHRSWRRSRADNLLYFFHSFYLNILSVRNLGPAKRRALSKAARVYATEVGACTIRQVPQAATVIDFVVQPQPGFRYFQHSEEQAGRIRISSPSEETVFAIRNLFDKLPDIEHDSEIIRVFSPEHRLIQMYISILRMLPLPLLLPEPSYVRLLQQAIEEAEEGSFTHSVRAIGIAAEELLVEVFETIIREKAPQVPLGNLLKDLNNRLQSIMHGNKAPATADFKTLHKELQTLTNAETKTAHPNPQLVSLVKLIQNSVIPTVNACSQLAASIAKSNPATPKTGLFPPRVQRCVDELVDLRNLVSHRVERASSLTPVGHIDAALAFRDYIAIAVWWLQERTRIDYKADPKAIIEGIISRNRSNASA